MTSFKNLLQTFLPLKPYSKGFVKPALVACALSFFSASGYAQDFRTLRDIKVNDTALDLSTTNCKIIPRNAMHSRYRLQSLILPLQLDSVGTQAFFACKNIEGTLRFPATTRVVSAAAFNGCSKLTELSFDGSTRLGAFAFANCRGLRVVRLSATVPPVCADNAFDGIDLSRVSL